MIGMGKVGKWGWRMEEGRREHEEIGEEEGRRMRR